MEQVAKTVVRDFHTKIVGVTYGNSDGSSRQEYIKKLKPGDELVFRPVPTSEYPDAVGVFTLKGEQLGHLNADLAAELKNKYPTNYMQATVANVTGGNDMNYGCNVHIVVYGEVSEQAENQPIDQQSANQAVKPKRKTWLWVLGWIFIFPLPLTLILLKKQNMNKVLKYVIIAAAWILYIAIVIGSATSNNNKPNPVDQTEKQATIAATEAVTEKSTEEPTEKSTEKPTEKQTENSTEGVSREYSNALKQAESYLKNSAFSKDGLYDQLLFEKYSKDAATYAVENVSTNWNENALKSAESYISHSAFSQEGLYDQLLFEKYTEEQARYGADNVNADWNEMAVKQAEQYLKLSSFSKDKLYEQLIFEKYTPEQAQYAVDKVY